METATGVPLMARYNANAESQQEDSEELILTRDSNLSQLGAVSGEGMKIFWMKIYWMNGRVSVFPLTEDFTKWEKNGQTIKSITALFKSSAYLEDYMDDIIYLDK